MRRTALRDSFSSRLISRRLWPCAFSSRTPLRISIGIMFAIPFDVVLKALEVSLRARQRRHQLRRDWDQHGKPLAHPADQLIDAPQVGLALAFRTVARSWLNQAQREREPVNRKLSDPLVGPCVWLVVEDV